MGETVLHDGPGRWKSPQVHKIKSRQVKLTGAAHPILMRPVISPTGLIGQLYGPSVIVTQGGRPPYTFSILSGSLPPGLSISTTSGTITGTPTTVGTYTFVIRVIDTRQTTQTTPSITILTGYGFDFALWDAAYWS
jgi:hypothetical protein